MKIDYEKILKTVTCNGMRELTDARVLQAMQEAVQQSQSELQSRITELEEERDHYGGLTYGMMKEIREMQTKIIGLEEENKRLRDNAREIAAEAWEAGIKWYHDEGEYGLSNTLKNKKS